MESDDMLMPDASPLSFDPYSMYLDNESSARDPKTPSKARRRSARACQRCRGRKVRCDVVHQAPCTNCRMDQIQCVVQEDRRGRLVVDILSCNLPTSINRLQKLMEVNPQPEENLRAVFDLSFVATLRYSTSIRF